MEWAKLNAAGNAAMAKINPPAPRPGRSGLGPSRTPRVGLGPDRRRPRHHHALVLSTRAPDISKNVPMLIGSVSEEGNRMSSKPTEEEWHATLAAAYGEAKANALIAAMKKAHPEKSIRTLSYGVERHLSRAQQRAAHGQDEIRTAGGAGLRSTTSPGNRRCWRMPGAWHTAELAFCFDNTKRCEQGTGNTPEAQALAKKMATAWANFARTGNPSQPGLTWTPTIRTRCQTMVFDNHCRMVDDPEGEVRKILLS